MGRMRMGGKISEWAFLDEALTSAGHKKCFQVTGQVNQEAVDEFRSRLSPLPNDYLGFLKRYGEANLFRDPKQQGYRLFAYSPRFSAADRKDLDHILIGFCDWGGGCFVLARKGQAVEGVFETRGGGFMKVASTFREWLFLKWNKCKREMGKRRWEQMMRVPDPFSKEEALVAEAASRFKIETLRRGPDSSIRVRVTNKSELILPRITAQALIPNRMHGFVALDTSDIPPGSEKTFEFVWFPGVDSRNLTLNRIPKAEPEDRAFYYELGALLPGERRGANRQRVRAVDGKK